MMKEIGISVSPKQASRLRNGHSVRVKGGGIKLMVEPDRYDTLSNSFRDGRGKQISLSPMEIQANRAICGGGIFGPAADKFFDKLGIKKQVYQVGDVLKSPVKKIIHTIAAGTPAATAAGAAALAVALEQPQLALAAGDVGRRLGSIAGKYAEKHMTGYIDDPEAYQADPRKKLMGGGLYASSSRGGAIIGLAGGMVPRRHPAMDSQPFSSHFQQQHMLPPNFQKFHNMGSGLYA